MQKKPFVPQMQRTADRDIPFVVRAPGAKEVVVTGDFTNWSRDGIRLDMKSDDEWFGTLRLPSGRHQYRLLIDGEWRDDPDALVRVPNPFGTENCVLDVS
ncbi:MAG: glycoside hydrolase [Planctomycetes bacterium]|nr:glycoside hydrolase [Planctomycetota bacterium]